LASASAGATGGGAATGDYVNLSKSADQTIGVGSSAVITFDGVANGQSSLFNNANDTVNVISGPSLVRVVGTFFQTATYNDIRKNGSTSYGGRVTGDAQNEGRRSIGTAPLSVASGDAFDFFATQSGVSSATEGGASTTGLGLEIMEPATRYCVARRSGDLSLGAGSINTIGWDGTDLADTDSMHDPVTNNSRIVVPSGVSVARPFLFLRVTGSGNNELSTWIDKSGATYNGRPVSDTENALSSTTGINLSMYGAIIPVTGGTDYFTASIFSEGATTLKGGNNESWFGVECFSSGYSYCTAYKAATQAITGGVTATLLLTGEVADTNNCHDTGSNTGNFVCPAGKSKARMTFNIKSANTAGNVHAFGLKNGSHIQGLPHDARKNDGDEALNGFGNWIPVTSGDILRVDIVASASQTLPATGETWVCVEWA
jgi:hypothetical protein